MSRYTITDHITDLDSSIIRTSPEEKIGSVLSQIQSTHQPAFVFKNGQFEGLVSPSYSIFTKKHHYLSSVKTCIFHPPKITAEMPLYEVAENMIITKLYTLPVFDHLGGKIIGVIRARTILENLYKNRNLFNELQSHITIQKPIMHPNDTTINEVHKLLKNKKIARMILTDDEGKLTGIISRSDIQRAFAAETPRQRFGKKMNNLMYASYFEDEKKKREDAPIQSYFSRDVLTASVDSSKRTLLKKIIESDKHSVVITRQMKPIGFISRHDFLNALIFLKPDVGVRVLVPDPKNNLSQGERLLIIKLLAKYGNKIQKRIKLDRIELHFKTAKNAVGHINTYELKLLVIPVKGKKLVAELAHRDLERGIYNLIGEIDSQLDT
jgi:CBS domain-containing protein